MHVGSLPVLCHRRACLTVMWQTVIGLLMFTVDQIPRRIPILKGLVIYHRTDF